MPKKKSKTGNTVVKALAKKAGVSAQDPLVEKARKNEVAAEASDYLDVFYALAIEGEFLVSSFSTLAGGRSIEEFWERLVEYIYVEVKWWHEDRKLTPDFSVMQPAYFYRIDPKSGILERLDRKEQYEALCRDTQARQHPTAYFAGVPNDTALALILKRFREIYPGSSLQKLKLKK